jgi:glycine/D-amino acid oxidase-like deaminating enzyme/nitrite reductase/ring-hydroxylating ferredoxin subunit
VQQNDHFENGDFTSGANISCWFDKGIVTNDFSKMGSSHETDVVIIGGGIAGLTAAYCIACSGKKVIVVEDGFIGSGETGRTTAQIATALDQRYYMMEDTFGREETKLIAESHVTAINFIEATILKEKISCDFERLNGYLFLHPSDKKENLEKEFDALCRSGINAVMMERTPGIPYEKDSILFQDQAQFQPMKYILGLCKAIENKGGQIFIQTHASKIDHTGIKTESGFTVSAEHVVVATNAPVNDLYAMMLKQLAYRSYVIGALIRKNKIPKALWWDSGDRGNPASAPYHYVRTRAHNDEYDLLICGGEDHPVGENLHITEKERYELLEKWTRERFPIEVIIYQWSGEVLVPIDSIAYIGRNRFDKDNVYIITGDSGIGMTYCTIGGMLVSDLINGVKNKLEEIYDPARFILKTSKPFFGVLKDDLLHVLKKWFYKETVELDAVKADEGKIVEFEGKKCGAYRDSSGKLFLVSAECTHLKCMVVWNDNEKSWDCPCHGSRFTFTGKVINGPANIDLACFSED